MLRDNHCSELRESDIGSTVTLAGWVFRWRDHGGLIFIDLRDREGITQIVFSPDVDAKTHQQAHHLRSEYVISVTGEVRRRPEGTLNPDLATGAIEVYVNVLNVLNESEALPFQIEETTDVSETVRLRHRYLDLRRPGMLRNLTLRHKTAKAARDYLDREGFLEVETPMLTRSTPEGARDYLVPSRVNPGQFYALPQSPQLFKQLLMISGIEKYFQIVKCFRDEDLRADRQPEFTQIDMEMSFVDIDDVIAATEGMLGYLFREVLGHEVQTPIQRMSYKEAMERFGTDKPDLRFALELKDMADLAEKGSFKVFLGALESGGRVKGLLGKNMAGLSRKEIDLLTKQAQSFGAKGLAWIKVTDDGFDSPIKKFFPGEVLDGMKARLEAGPGDLMLFVADEERVVFDVLGRLRLDIGQKQGLVQDGYKFLWVTDFPLLEWNEEEGRYSAMHHPFTAVTDEDMGKLMAGGYSSNRADGADMGAIMSKAYDIVLNGFEIGGGSIRIHQPDVQRKMLELLGISDDEASRKFGFLIDALKFGAPPHGGIALGLDRLVMIMAGATSIRDVIAFPKTQKAACMLSGAPSSVDARQMKELSIKLDVLVEEN